MDESGIEATQALDLGDYDDEDVTDDELGDSTPVAYLNVTCQKGFAGKLFPVYEGDNVIGRGDDCKISIPLKALSREHACIEVKGDAHFIYDKGSRNRTRRNNHFLAASVRYELKDKDRLIFGDVECEYQIGTKGKLQAADDSDETCSESMFQTAPDDEELENSTEMKNETEVKPPEDEDYASDASSDILEPTQPSVGNTQSMFGHKTLNGNSTLAQNITVKETPAAPRTKRFTEDMVLPESGSDTDDEYSTKPPATLAIAPDSQDDDDEEEMKSRVMGAATQAYVCESDVSTDDEEDISHKRSLLAAPTQAFVDDDDDSTCSENSPKKKMLLTAATQAFAADTDEEKKQDKIGPTLPYTMDVDIEPTQGYDMEVDAEEKDENEEEGKKSGSILYEPTQAYLGIETAKDQGEGSDTSEEFVLEGDTDAEDEGDVGEMLAAPTLACDEADEEVPETQVVSTEDPTQVFDDLKQTGKKSEHKLDETLPVTELETQVFEENNKTSQKPVTNDDATQVFDENIQDSKNNESETVSHAVDTQVVDEKATQVFDTERKNEQTAETQVFSDDATQCFDEESNGKVKGSKVVDSKVFDEPTQVVDGESDNKKKLAEQNEIATQVFDKIDDMVTDDEGRTFDITAASTLAVNEDLNEDSNIETNAEADDSTQVFDSTVDVDQTVQIEAEICQKESRGKRKKSQVVAEKMAVSDATQVLTEEPIQSKSKKKKQMERNNDNDDATQVFDETLVINENQTVANKEEHTVAVNDGATQVIEEKCAKKPSRGKKTKVTAGETLALSDDSNQVNDQTVPVTEDQTVAITEDQTVAITEDQTIAVTEDQTIAVTEDQTDANHEGASQDLEGKLSQSKASRGRRKQAKKMDDTAEGTKDISQDETVAVNDNQTVALTEKIADANKEKLAKVKTGGRRKQEEEINETVSVNKEARQASDENVQSVEAKMATVKPVSKPNVELKGKRNKASKKVKNEIVAENVEGSTSRLTKNADDVNEKSGDEPNSIATRKSSRTRGKQSIPKNGAKKEEAFLNESKKTEQKDDNTKKINESKQTKRGKKTGIASKKAEIEATANIPAETEQPSEAATQMYEDSGDEEATKRFGDEAVTQRYGDSGDEAATQRYGDSGDEAATKRFGGEAATQRYGDAGDEAATQKYGEVEDEDLTPDLDEIVEEKIESVPVVAETSRGRPTLKSALASPQKSKSPSPKKVQFVSQDSETGSESAGPARRSKRGNKGKQKVVDTEPSLTSKETKSVVETQSKKTRPRAGTTLEKVRSETDTESEAVKEPQENNKTAECVIKGKVNKRLEKNKDIKIDNSSDNVESGPVASAAVKSTRRGRKSVDTEVSNKEENNKRKSRTSLPAVLEENELGAPKNRGKKKVNKTPVEEGNTNEGEIESDKNILNEKDIIHEQKEECKSDTTQGVKRSARHTKAAVEENEMENPKETRSDTHIDHSETVKEPKSTRSGRNVRKRDNNETLESKDTEHADGNKKEPKTQASARTRKSKCNAEENQTSEVKDGKGSVVMTDDKVSARNKAGRRGNRKSNVESKASETQINESKSEITDMNTDQTDSTDKDKDKGRSGKGKKAKSETEMPADDKNLVKTDQEMNTRSKGSSRSKKGNVSKSVKKEEQEGLKEDNLPARSSRLKEDVSNTVMEEKQEQLKEDNQSTRSRRLKRKESDNSSNDSQESKEGETPAKRQKQKTNNNLSTPKNKGKESCTVTTPRQLDTSITNSPTLRKTTTEGGKAKVMFTGVIDEQGEKVIKELGGELVSSVTECTHLVTDQVRRTVKFLCCLSRGIPIVSPQWLASSKTSAFFVDPTPFLVKDDASERKYKFRLDQSIDKASKEQVFQGFTFHVTKSVKPEPQHMSEILKCAGAKCTNKMPCSGQGMTVVISCPEDQGQCEPAYEAGIPVMTAEFVLTGILRQEVDFQSFKLVKEENGRKRQATTLGHETSKKRKR